MQPRILVIGDAMTDVYHVGTATRISPEAPIPVVRISNTTAYHGGAANVAANLTALGADARLVRGTRNGQIPHKHRLMVGETQIARWDETDQVDPVDLEHLDQAVLHWEPDAVVVSDYGKGSVIPTVLQWVLDQQRPTFVDTKGSPSWLPNATLFPNRSEYEAYRDQYDICPNVVLKRSEVGIAKLSYGKVVEEYPAWATSVVSVCGAGDTVLAAYVYASCVGLHPLPFANAAAAIVVGKPRTATASVEEIMAKAKEVAGCHPTNKE